MSSANDIANNAPRMHGAEGGWLAGRLGHWLHWLWFGGAVAVNLLVWALLGVRYIPIALVAYVFVFVLCFRREIKRAYPPRGNLFFGDGPTPWPHHTRRGDWTVIFVVLGLHLLTNESNLLYFGELVITENALGDALIAILIAAYFNFLLLLRHGRVFAAFRNDCDLWIRSVQAEVPDQAVIYGKWTWEFMRFCRRGGRVSIGIMLLLLCLGAWLVPLAGYGNTEPGWLLGPVVYYALIHFLLWEGVFTILILTSMEES